MSDPTRKKLDSMILMAVCGLLSLGCGLNAWQLRTTFDNSRQLTSAITLLEANKEKVAALELTSKERDAAIEREMRSRDEAHERDIIELRTRITNCEIAVAKFVKQTP